MNLVLFGSRARGDYEESSDVDVAVIVRGLSRELKDRVYKEVAGIELEHCQPIALLVQPTSRTGTPDRPGYTGGGSSPVTEANRRENIREELERADRSLEAANSTTIRSHEGALRLFALHFVKTGAFPADSSHSISKFMKFREEADYNPSYMFISEDYRSLRQEAESLAHKVRAFLRQEGYQWTE